MLIGKFALAQVAERRELRIALGKYKSRFWQVIVLGWLA